MCCTMFDTQISLMQALTSGVSYAVPSTSRQQGVADGIAPLAPTFIRPPDVQEVQGPAVEKLLRCLKHKASGPAVLSAEAL